MRRSPRQERSQKRVELILEAAASIFEEVGYEAATTNAIAERANTSIGSLYRFFPDKCAIFHALTLRYMEQMRQTADLLLHPAVVGLPLSTLFKETIETFHNLLQSQPALKAIWLYAKASPDLAEIDSAMTRQTTAQVTALLKKKARISDEVRLALAARVSVEIMNTLMSLLVMEPKEMAGPLKAEFQNILTAYISQYVAAEPVNDSG